MADTVTVPITLPREFVALLGAPAQAAETAREYILLGCTSKAVPPAAKPPSCWG